MKQLSDLLKKYKYVALVLAVGLALLLWPNAPPATTAAKGDEIKNISLSQTLSQMLTDSAGVGQAEVLLTDRGAVVLCDGAEDARTRAAICEAISTATGLGFDRITILQSKK